MDEKKYNVVKVRDDKTPIKYLLNTAMMIITVISMFVAVAAWLLPDILG